MKMNKGKVNISFLGIGIAKGGTTWVTKCLHEHPDIYIPHQKELAFFDSSSESSNYSRGFSWYNKFFTSAKETQKIGEFTTHYMYMRESANLIYQNYPEIKLIACLRNPVDAAYSLYWWKKANYETNNVPDTFEKAIKENDEYIQRGMMYDQLKVYFDLFNKNQIKVILMDDIKSDSLSTIQNLYKYLEVDSKFIPPSLSAKVNTSRKPRSKALAKAVDIALSLCTSILGEQFTRDITSSHRISDSYSMINKVHYKYPNINAKTKAELVKIFKSDIKSLEKLINRDLSNWLK